MPDSPLVKICGVTSLGDAAAAIAAGADWIGLNFHPASPRFVDIDVAKSITDALGSSCVFVGVFVDCPIAEVLDVAKIARLDVVQLHGSEPDSDVLALRSAGFRVIRAARIGDVEAVDRLISALDRSHSDGSIADFLLLDAFVPGQAGGTGVAIGEDVLDSLPISGGFLEFGPGRRIPLILAGGLHPGNVSERAARVRPWMVDVASGVESSPGQKDPRAMEAFVRAAKRRSRQGSRTHTIRITDPLPRWKGRLTTCAVDILQQIRLRSLERGLYAVDRSSIVPMALWSLLLWERKVGLVALERSGVDRFDLARGLDRLLDQIIRDRPAAFPGGRDGTPRTSAGELIETWDFEGLMGPLLDRAEEESKALGHNYIGSEHLLLAILQLGDPPLMTLLEQTGVSLDRVRQSVVEVLGS